MSLHGVGIDRNDLNERIEGDVADVVVVISKELAENIDCHHT